MRRTAACLTIAAAALAAAGSAAAQTRLSYADLDLGRPKDAHAFRLRMENAAAYVCRAEVSTGSRHGGRGVCEARARADMLDSLPAETRAVYQAALAGRASDTLTRARAPAAAQGGGNVTSTVAPPN